MRAIDPLADWRALRALERALRTERPPLVHTHSSKAGILGREAAVRSGVPRVVHTVHGWGFTPHTARPVRAVYRALERRAARRSDALVFVSPGDLAEGRRLDLVGNARCVLIPPGIDLAPARDPARLRTLRATRRRELGVRGNEVVLGFLGRLAPQKDPMRALETFLQLSSPSARMVFVGDGELRPTLHARARERGETRVLWAGLQPEPWSWLAAMDLLLLPSRWEGSPLVVPEALALGLPLVASDLPGTRAVLGAVDPDALLAGSDPAGWARAVDARLASRGISIGGSHEHAPPWEHPDGMRLRRHALEHHDLASMCASVETLYDDLLRD